MILSMSEVEDINPEGPWRSISRWWWSAREPRGARPIMRRPTTMQAAASAAGYMFDCGVKSLAVVGGRGAYDEASCSARWKATRNCVCAASSKNADDAA